MKTIYIKHPHNFLKEDLPEMVMALGYFDGVHYGHQKVILTAKQFANENNYKSAVMTFHPHPSVMLGKLKTPMEYITPLEEKEKRISELGIDYLYIIEFDPTFANLLPQQFVDTYLIGLNVKHVVAGFDFTYGRLGKGTMEILPFHSRDQFTQTVIEQVSNQNEKISSTLIRQHIRNGEIGKVPSLLGRFYSIKGMVIDGEKRGRTIGFPTANISLMDDYITPAVGVYAVKINIEDNWYHAICNIGFKPTFIENAPEKPTIEVHIFDFNKQIYGETVTVEWHERIRSEKKFKNVEDLIQQITHDKQEAIKYFKKQSEQTCFLS